MDLQQLLTSFEQYYTIKTEQVLPPFAAEAEFHSHTEHYLLVRAAQIAESESHEFVFFAEEKELTPERFTALCNKAWETGLKRVKPHFGLRNADVVLIILAQQVATRVWSAAQKTNYFKSHCLHGLSHFKVLIYQTSSGKTACNRYAQDLEKLIQKINTQKETI